MEQPAVVVDVRPVGEATAGDEDLGPELDVLEGAAQGLDVELEDDAVPALLDRVLHQEAAVVVGEVVLHARQLPLDRRQQGRLLLLLLDRPLPLLAV